jgi:hypothetical protein
MSLSVVAIDAGGDAANSVVVIDAGGHAGNAVVAMDAGGYAGSASRVVAIDGGGLAVKSCFFSFSLLCQLAAA